VTEPTGRGPNVNYPPPLWFVAGFVVGWLLETRTQSLWPAMSLGPTRALAGLGWILIVVAAGLLLAGLHALNRMKTAVFPNRDARVLVVEGPYRFTRNPIYLAMALAYLGLALQARMGWPILLLPLVLFGLNRAIIAREERHLLEAFGQSYRVYCSTVRRWL